jgi:hypothetical protein
VRRERLERWVELLARLDVPVRLLSRIEYLPRAERLLARADNSPIEIAYRDPLLRAQGLASDRLGDAMAFFDLTFSEAHHLVCDCHYVGGVTSGMVAARMRAVARRMSFGEILAKVRSAVRFR